jgi:hypothetical protein
MNFNALVHLSSKQQAHSTNTPCCNFSIAACTIALTGPAHQTVDSLGILVQSKLDGVIVHLRPQSIVAEFPQTQQWQRKNGHGFRSGFLSCATTYNQAHQPQARISSASRSNTSAFSLPCRHQWGTGSPPTCPAEPPRCCRCRHPPQHRLPTPPTSGPRLGGRPDPQLRPQTP